LNYVVSIHAAEELEDDNLTILDLESVLSWDRSPKGKEIAARARPRLSFAAERSADSKLKRSSSSAYRHSLRHHDLCHLNNRAPRAASLESAPTVTRSLVPGKASWSSKAFHVVLSSLRRIVLHRATMHEVERIKGAAQIVRRIVLSVADFQE